jgi:AcrR family transcriptional regulator
VGTDSVSVIGIDAVEIVAPRQERSVASTQRLIEAATELFVERGYTATTLAAVGERAGFSRGIVTMRFGSKENLAWAVVERAARSWEAVLRTPAEAAAGTVRGLDAVVAFVRASEQSMVDDPTARLVLERLYAESAAPMAPLHDRFQDGLRSLEARVARFVRRGIDDGSVRPDIDPALVAGVLIAQLRGIGYQWFLFPALVDPVAYHRVVLDQVTTWLQPV